MLRAAAAGDGAFLRALYLDTRRGEFAALPLPPAQLQQLLQLQFTAQCRHYAAHYPRAEQYIVQHDDVAVGRLLIDRASDGIRIVDVSLLRTYRGRGLGTGLVRALQGEAAARGVPLRLSVRRDNPAARLYARLGFLELAADEVYRELEWSAEATG